MTERKYDAQMHRIRDAVANSDWSDIGRVTPETIMQGYEYFDQTLATHDAEVAVNALGRYADRLGVDVGDEDSEWWDGYRHGQRAALVIANEQIEREASNAR